MGRSQTGKLAENIIHFGRALRLAGIAIGPSAVVDAIRAVEVAGIAGREDFYWTLHAIFVKRREHHAVFDEAFRLFWRSRKHLGQMLASGPESTVPEARRRAAATRAAEALFGAAPVPRAREPDEIEIDARLSVSDREVLRRRDFAQMTADEVREAERQIEALRLPADFMRTRRSVATRSPVTVDARRTLRASLRTGGKMIPLRYRRPAEVHPPIVALCDISGSMSQYTRMFLHFIYVLGQHRRVQAFLFGTRLSNVTRELRRRDPDEALAACAEAVPDWSGGTRIAAALREFNRRWSRRVLGQGAILLLFSDGLERDEGEDLGTEMDRLHRSCRRLVWLNPLLRFEGFAAKARGIRSMLPHVDEFRPIHSLESMAELCHALAEGSAGNDPQRWLKAA
jgi:uncharacterized protein with von Willebrand factor type A (vWA) domain